VSRINAVEDSIEKPILIGDRLTLNIERVAHGGHFIAHARGVTLFVRGAITGEEVVAEVVHLKKRIALAEVVEVITPSPHRQVPPCHYFAESVCGGCDFQHIDLEYQRELKAEVVMDTFRRIAGVEVMVHCFPASEPDGVDGPGFHWRTRMDFTLTPEKRIALYPHRSNALTEVTSCLLAETNIDISLINERVKDPRFQSGDRVRVGLSSDGEMGVSPLDSRTVMKVFEKEFPISLQSFWQPHRLAATTLVSRMQSLLQIRSGDIVLDLYGGVGLFTAFLRDEVGDQGAVTLIESDSSALEDATRIFEGDSRVRVVGGKVEEELAGIERCDLIVLDPPRVGLSGAVVAEFDRLRPRQILYISCDPATLARDSKSIIEVGYVLASLEAHDLFPMTEHIESVANFILLES
jgi:tRNA/tmRNA/rRNA uracil-C5-methylase (TrmA/RlmC/RlmD family)